MSFWSTTAGMADFLAVLIACAAFTLFGGRGTKITALAIAFSFFIDRIAMSYFEGSAILAVSAVGIFFSIVTVLFFVKTKIAWAICALWNLTLISYVLSMFGALSFVTVANMSVSLMYVQFALLFYGGTGNGLFIGSFGNRYRYRFSPDINRIASAEGKRSKG